MRRWLAVGTLLVVALLAVFVWPTRYRYDKVGDQFLRTDRVSGETARLTSWGWAPLRASEPATAPTVGHVGAPRYTTAQLPSCDHNNTGALAFDTTAGALKSCNGAAWATLSGEDAELQKYLPQRLRKQ